MTNSAIAIRVTGRTWTRRRLNALRVATQVAGLGLGPVMLYLTVLWVAQSRGVIAVDFRHAYLPAAHDVLHGRSPYPSLDDPTVAAGAAYVYSAPLALASMPFLAVSPGIAAWAVTLLLLALVPVTLLVLQVRDWRCYGAALLWGSVGSAIQTANVSIPFALVLALAWRYRHRYAGIATGLATALKIFTWPLLVWLLATRRYRQALAAGVAALAIVVAAWAVVGFDTFPHYVSLVHRVNDLEASDAYSVYGLLTELGAPAVIGKAVWLLVGLAALAGCVLFGRLDNDRTSFAFAVAAALVLSPIVWLHYFTLLLVPLAVVRPRFGLAWLLPVLLWTAPADANHRSPWQTGLTLAVVMALVAAATLPKTSSRRRPLGVLRRA